MQVSVLYVVDGQHENLILEFWFCVPDPRIAAISSLFCTKQYNGNAETRMNDLISFHFKRLAFSPSLGPLASSGPPGVPSPLSKTANVPYFRRHLEMSQSLTVKYLTQPIFCRGEKNLRGQRTSDIVDFYGTLLLIQNLLIHLYQPLLAIFTQRKPYQIRLGLHCNLAQAKLTQLFWQRASLNLFFAEEFNLASRHM